MSYMRIKYFFHWSKDNGHRRRLHVRVPDDELVLAVCVRLRVQRVCAREDRRADGGHDARVQRWLDM